MMSTVKSRHIWIIYILLAAVVLPIHGLNVPNGNVTKYVYSATGEKLRVIYQTAVPNITVAIGNSRELSRSEIQYTDSMNHGDRFLIPRIRRGKESSEIMLK